MAINLNEIPKRCLIKVFCNFPLQQLIPLRIVCKKWKLIIENKCRKKKSLKLFGSLENVEHYVWHLKRYNLEEEENFALKRVGFNEFLDDDIVSVNFQQHFNDFAYLFGSLENFVNFGGVCKFSFEIMVIMTNLTSLTLCDTIITIQTLESLNLTQSLKILNLFDVDLEEMSDLPELSFMDRLEQFSLCDFDADSCALLVQLGSGLKSLTIKSINLTIDEMEKIFGDDSTLSMNLEILKLGSICLEDASCAYENKTRQRQMFRFVCENFKMVKFFEFCPHQFEFCQDELLYHLNQLEKLTTLKLDGFWNLEEQPLEETKLGTIKSLYLNFHEFASEPFPKINLKSIFPNLQQIHISGDVHILLETKSYFESKKFAKDNSDLMMKFNQKQEASHYMGRHRERYERHLEEHVAQLYELHQHFDALNLQMDDSYHDGHEYDYSPDSPNFRIIFIDYTNMYQH